MAVTIQDVEKIARLAKLSFSHEEKQKLTGELNTILDYMETLNELNTENVDPLSHVIQISNVFREDTVRQGLSREEALKNAPSRSEKFFRVPKVLGDR